MMPPWPRCSTPEPPEAPDIVAAVARPCVPARAAAAADVARSADIARGWAADIIAIELEQPRPWVARPDAAHGLQAGDLGIVHMDDTIIAMDATARERALDGLALPGIAKHELNRRMHSYPTMM